jgi:hypothetical protein
MPVPRRLLQRLTVLSSYPNHWAVIDVVKEVDIAVVVLDTFRRKLRDQPLTPDDLETLSNVFRFNVLGSRGAFWHAGLRVFRHGTPSTLRQRTECLSVIVPLSYGELHYGLDKSSPEYGTLHYGEAWLIESKPGKPLQQIVVEDADAPVECLIVTFDSLDLSSALANI